MVAGTLSKLQISTKPIQGYDPLSPRCGTCWMEMTCELAAEESTGLHTVLTELDAASWSARQCPQDEGPSTGYRNNQLLGSLEINPLQWVNPIVATMGQYNCGYRCKSLGQDFSNSWSHEPKSVSQSLESMCLSQGAREAGRVTRDAHDTGEQIDGLQTIRQSGSSYVVYKHDLLQRRP